MFIWKIELIFFLCFFFLIISLMLKSSRILKFLIYLEIFSLLLIYLFFSNFIKNEYSMMMKLLVLISCESAIGLSLLVLIVRKFSVDKTSLFSKKLCEGF